MTTKKNLPEYTEHPKKIGTGKNYKKKRKYTKPTIERIVLDHDSNLFKSFKLWFTKLTNKSNIMKKTGFVLTSFLLLSLSAFSQYSGGEGGGSSSNTSITCIINNYPFYFSKGNNEVLSVNNTREDNTVLPVETRIDIVNLFPTPGEDKITVLLYSTESTKVNVNILNVFGQQTSIAKEVSVTKGSNELTIDIKAFSSGYHILEIQTTSGLYLTQKQFVIK